jgi:putative thioredoxin
LTFFVKFITILLLVCFGKGCREMKYDTDNFAADVLERSRQIPVLVDFWAEWCGPCKMLGPVLEKLAAQSNGRWTLAKVNTEEHQDVAAKYSIRSIPNVKLFVDEKVAAEFVGALPETMVQQWLRKNVPSRFRNDIDHAEHMLIHGDIGEAQKILESVVQSDPENDEARVLLARILLFSDQQEAARLVENITHGAEAFDAAEAIRTILSLFEKSSHAETLSESPNKLVYLGAIEKLRSTDFAAALQKFIDVIRDERYYDDDGARKACIAIFKLLGEDHDTTKKFRREFSRSLY